MATKRRDGENSAIDHSHQAKTIGFYTIIIIIIIIIMTMIIIIITIK